LVRVLIFPNHKLEWINDETGEGGAMENKDKPQETKDNEDRKKGEALARSQTDPLYLQDHFLRGGRDKDTKNATATFVQFCGKQYVVTCRHVLEIVQKRKERSDRARFPTMALVVERAVLNLSFFSAQGLQYALRTPKPDEGDAPLDLAIAEVSGAHWSLLAQRKGKTAIDLDNWREPKWVRAKMLVAAGYPDEQKTHVKVDQQNMLGAPFVLLAAEKKGTIDRHHQFAEMYSRLPQPHGYHFSGMSGGAMYIVQGDIIIPMGIVFEGWPQSRNSKPHPTLTANNIYIRGLTLTPATFSDWLVKANLNSPKSGTAR
jgi:hypothetical protein